MHAVLPRLERTYSVTSMFSLSLSLAHSLSPLCVLTLREITKKEAVRTKRSLRAFHEGRAGLLALVIGLGRLGLITLPDGGLFVAIHAVLE